MTQTAISQSKSKDSKESNVAYSKIMNESLTKSSKVVISLDDKGENVFIQKESKNLDRSLSVKFGFWCIIMFITFASFMLFAVQQQQLQRLKQQSSSVEVIMIEVKDQRVSNPVEKPELLEVEPKANGNGTRVLVYDGKQRYVTWPDPPPKDELASVARYVMHISEFGSLATNSTHKGIEGYPFVNVFSVSDGPFNKSTGIPYFYFTPLELSVIDLKASKKASLTLTEAQSDYCSKKGFDPEDPRCAHVIFTGDMEMIEGGTEEEEFARNALFSRHVEMKSWPSNHAWFFAKLVIKHIYILDFFGGAGVVDVDDYFAASPFGSKKND